MREDRHAEDSDQDTEAPSALRRRSRARESRPLRLWPWPWGPAASPVAFQPEYKIADPICTYVFSLLMAFTTFRIIWDTVVIILEGKCSLGTGCSPLRRG